MENKGLELWRHYVKQPQLWPGWEHGKTPVAFHDAERAVLFGHPNPGPGFSPREADGLSYHVAEPKPASFTANTAVYVAGVMTATIMWQELDQEKMLGLITHEAFHAYQMARGCPFGQIALAMKYPVNDALVQALAEVEARLLLGALTQQEDNLNLVHLALDARAARQAALPQDIAQFEDEVELGEGLATYIEVKTAGSNSGLWQGKVETLNKLNRGAWGADRLRFYYSGMAWALLCDQHAPNWQSREWQPMARVLAEALDYTPSPQRREYAPINFPEILARQEDEARTRQEEMDRTLAQALPGTGLQVELFTIGTPIGGGWNPMTAVTFPGVGRFHPTGLMYNYDTGGNFKVESNCLEKDPCRHVLFEGQALQVTLNGQAFSAGSGLGCLDVTGTGVKLHFPRAQVSLKGKQLIVTEA